MKEVLFVCNTRYLVSLFDHYTSVIEHYENIKRIDPKMKSSCDNAIEELVNQKRHILSRIKKQVEFLKTELNSGK